MKRLRVLIVEDEALLALQLEMNLVSAGYEVCGIASEGGKAIELAREQEPQVILMDINLFGSMDGIETAQRICGFLRARILFMTGYSDQGLRERAMVLGPAAYLVKPISFHQMIPLLAEP